MKKLVNNFLSNSDYLPINVDRLIISAYLQINNIQVEHNILLKSYLIQIDDQNDYQDLQNFVYILNDEFDSFDFENLIELFEFVVSPSDRVVNGAIYTPEYIRDYIVNQSFIKKYNNLNNVKVADISCGCAGFLFTAAKQLRQITGNNFEYIFNNQIFGLDIQEYSVTRSKLLLSLLAITEGEDVEMFNFNVYSGDALVFRWEDVVDNFLGFEVIIGNPPYVCARNLVESVKANLQNWIVCHSGNPDLYIPFFQIGFENLADGGILGYITMNSFFKSLNGRALRRYFKDNNVAVKVIDFGTYQIFKSKSTYTCICFLENTYQNHVQYYRSVKKELPSETIQYERILYDRLDSKKGWNLNHNEIISKIESVGQPFGSIYTTRHGIATLKNDLYIFKPVAEDSDFFYLQNGTVYPIEKGICKDILNSNKLSRTIDFNKVVEKVLFPYDNNQKPKALEEELLKEAYPLAYKYLKTKQNELSKRDKGHGKYEKWYAFGRTQSLEKVTNKLFFPKFSDKIPSYLISDDENLLFYNGQAIIGHSESEMKLIQKIMQSRLFWYYIKTTSKPYSSSYYSLNGTYIKNFGIPDFSEDEKLFLINDNNSVLIDEFLEDYYGVQLDNFEDVFLQLSI